MLGLTLVSLTLVSLTLVSLTLVILTLVSLTLGKNCQWFYVGFNSRLAAAGTYLWKRILVG